MKLFTPGYLKNFALLLISFFVVNYSASAQCGLTLSISGSTSTCAGNDTLTVSGASSAVQIVWQSATSTVTIDSAGGTIDTTYIPATSGSYVAIVTAPGGCLDTTSAMIVDSVVTPSVSFSGLSTLCAGMADTFTATPVNGGSSPGYQWYQNGTPVGGNAATFITSTLNNNDSIWVVMTSNAICATNANDTSSHYIVTVYSPAVDTITASICPSDSFVLGTQTYRTTGSFNDTLHAASINGCDSIVTLNLTVFSPAVDTITAFICPSDSFTFGSNVYYSAGFYNDTLHASSVNGCDSVITLNLSISSTVTPSVSISTNHSHTICVGTVITFTPHPTNGGSSPSYQWYVSGNPVSTSTIFVDSTLSNGDSVWVVMVSNASCATTDTVTSNIIPYVVDSFVTPGVTISSTNTGDTLCDNTMANLIAVGVNGGTNPDYQWQRNGVNVGNSDTYVANTILNGDVYTCIITSTATCVTQRKDTSSAITFIIIPYPTVAVSVSGGSTKVCPGDSVSLTASGGSSYIWSTGDTTQSIYSTGGIYTVTATGNYGCTAGSSILTIGNVISLTDSIRQVGDSLISGPSQFYQWYLDDSIISGAIGAVYVPTHSGEYQVAVIDSFGCVAYSELINIIFAGINTVSADPSAMIYPNPNSGTFTLTLTDQDTHTVTITDALGRVIADGQKATHNKQFALEGLTEGIYYLQIDNGRTIKFNIVR